MRAWVRSWEAFEWGWFLAVSAVVVACIVGGREALNIVITLIFIFFSIGDGPGDIYPACVL